MDSARHQSSPDNEKIDILADLIPRELAEHVISLKNQIWKARTAETAEAVDPANIWKIKYARSLDPRDFVRLARAADIFAYVYDLGPGLRPCALAVAAYIDGNFRDLRDFVIYEYVRARARPSIAPLALWYERLPEGLT
jgi:hypothetical protein